MRTRTLVWTMLVAGGAGVFMGFTTAGTPATPWIRVVLGALAMAAGASIFLAPDPGDQRIAHLMGLGIIVQGGGMIAPAGPVSIAMMLVGLTLMSGSVVLRRRRLARR